MSLGAWPSVQGGEGPLSAYAGLGSRPLPGGVPRDGRPGKPTGCRTPVSLVGPLDQKRLGWV